MIRILKILLAFLLSISFAKAQPDSIPPVVKIDTAVLAIGDQTHLRISLPVPKGKEALFPDFKKKIGESLEIISKTIDTLQKEGNIRQITHDYVITSFDTGYVYIPPFEVGIVENGFNSTITTDSTALYVTYPIVDMQKGIFDIKPPADLPFKFSELLPYAKIMLIVFFTLLAIAAVLLYYFLIYKKKKQQQIEEQKDTRPANEKAIDTLNELKEKQLWQNGRIKIYYSELTDIIRNYLDERFEMHTMESTSSEILSALGSQPIDNENRELLRFIFERADMAKFAKGQPMAHENDKSWNNALQFVQQTKPTNEENKEGGTK